MISIPRISSDTVFFIGNGVMRVPCQIISSSADNDGFGREAVGPSWTAYMDTLWGLVRESNLKVRPDTEILRRDDFSNLSAARQAEWFDRTYAIAEGGEAALQREDLPVLRLHELGRTLHSSPGLLTNPLLKTLARLVIQAARMQHGGVRQVDVITTNLDCSIEQNLAAALNAEGEALGTSLDGEIEVIVDFRRSVLWRSGEGAPALKIRLWKLHGCLRDLSRCIATQTQERVMRERSGNFCGFVPAGDELIPGVASSWRAIDAVSGNEPGESFGVFSQSEYFDNIKTLVQLGGAERETAALPYREKIDLYRALIQLLSERELLLVGYGLFDVDVDIQYLLQTTVPAGAATRRWKLTAQREHTLSEEERLNQLGIAWWPFSLSSLAYCPEPGRLRHAAAHEWRTGRGAEEQNGDASELWRARLQEVSAHAWMAPQLDELTRLLPNAGDELEREAARGETTAAVPNGRLVIAGLGSIWHAFSLQGADDFPRQRRVSAQLSSVDEQVPGGSGLVPVMVAAAIAGPPVAGRIAFLSNVPARWKSWKEIEEFCLSAGVDVRPLELAAGEAMETETARTSHVLIYDEHGSYQAPMLAKQRFILDVQSYVGGNPASAARGTKVPGVPGARTPVGFQSKDGPDFLFADKEVNWQSIRDWKGPTVLETGSSGIELLPSDKRGVTQPTIWTSGIGSFVRTVVEQERFHYEKIKMPQKTADVIKELRGRPALLPLLDGCSQECADYVGRLVSFRTPAGAPPKGSDPSIDDKAELAYGAWLQTKWIALAPHLRQSLRPYMGEPDERTGGGIVTTCHAAGLMAAWLYEDGSTEDIVVSIHGPVVSEGTIRYDLRCRSVHSALGELPQISAEIWISTDEHLHLRLTNENGSHETDLGVSTPYRRNTLAAGDTVRGALCYGLWALGLRPDGVMAPDSISRVMMASAMLATLKCYAGSFVDFLKLLERMRPDALWGQIWGSFSTAGR